MMKICKHFCCLGNNNRKCDLLEVGYTERFNTIRCSFKSKYPDREMVPNGCCFWEIREMHNCPFFEAF